MNEGGLRPTLARGGPSERWDADTWGGAEGLWNIPSIKRGERRGLVGGRTVGYGVWEWEGRRDAA
jgi:hypothetical protein